MALSFANAVPQCYSSTWLSESGAEKQTAYVKALRKPTAPTTFANPLWKKEGKK